MTPHCHCDRPGFCQRFGRDMQGRMWEICHGVNVDLGTAAAFREQWDREWGAPPAAAPARARPLCLITDQCPGDAVAMTAAIYSLHRAHPDEYTTSVESTHPEVFLHNPDVVPRLPGDEPIRMHYPAIHRSNERAIHFMQAWCEFLGFALGIDVPLMTDRPRLYLDGPTPEPEGFWLVCSGGKKDFTSKLWGHDRYQRVVNLLRGRVRFIQIGDKREDHPRLGDTIHDAVGETSLRGLFNLVAKARGVLCGVSLPMHVAAALGRPAVVIAGGREPVAWNAYPMQSYVHTVGALPCTSIQGDRGVACWRGRVVPLGDRRSLDENPCQRPVNGTPTSLEVSLIPQCMALIQPREVAEIILRYDRQYEVQTLQGQVG